MPPVRSYDLPSADIWSQVVRQAMLDLCDTSESVRDEAIRWLRPSQRKDFDMVCSAAGLEPSAVRKLGKRILALGPERGKVYLTQVMEVTTDDKHSRAIDQ